MSKIVYDVLRRIGNTLFDVFKTFGEIVILLRQTVESVFHQVPDHRDSFVQMINMGLRTFPVTGLTLLFTGMVLALQTGVSFIGLLNEPVYVGKIVSLSICKELGPVLTALVFSGRVGAAIAAELGTMKVTEQIDALYTLGTNPVRYLVVPRFIGTLLMLPLLTIYCNWLGIFGGSIVANLKFEIPLSIYWTDVYTLTLSEMTHGILKSVAFSLIIVTISCYKGLQTRGGAEGVGKSTTAAVVHSMVGVLIGDYFLSALLTAMRIG